MDTFKGDNITIQDFEQAAETLNRIIFSLTEKHLDATANQNDQTALALAQSALAIRAGLHSFIFIEKLTK
jgi:hypothetical protein